MPASGENFRMSALTGSILVVEDDPFFRALLTRRLHEEGFTDVQAVEDGLEALRSVRNGRIDLVLLDIELPGLDGIQVLHELKSDARLSDIPVIVISGLDEMKSVVRCLELGAEDYLPKPFDPAILRARINTSLEKRMLRRLEELRVNQIVKERERSQALLNVILPRIAARELMATGAVAPRRHEGVAVLFCDIVGFTAYCERHEPEYVVARLQSLIERFEQLTDAHEMEKIKTIGDSFMATAGMLQPSASPLRSVVHCGLDMIMQTPQIVPGWQVRIGVDCGRLVSGVLGRQRYQFDVWGSVVNGASRITECAPTGAVALRQAISLQIDAEFNCEPIGTKQLKGLGEVDLVGIFPAIRPRYSIQ